MIVANPKLYDSDESIPFQKIVIYPELYKSDETQMFQNWEKM